MPKATEAVAGAEESCFDANTATAPPSPSKEDVTMTQPPARALAGFALALFALVVGPLAFTAPAQAVDGYTVTASNPGRSDYGTIAVELCDTACYDSSGPKGNQVSSPYYANNSGENGGAVTFTGVPANTYRVAVEFTTPTKSGDYAYHAGYLRYVSGNYYQITSVYSEGTPFTISQDTALGTLVAGTSSTPPGSGGTSGGTGGTAPQPKPYPTARVTPRLFSTLGTTVSFVYHASNVKRGTIIKMAVHGCGGRIVATKRIVRTGSYQFYKQAPSRRVKRMAYVTVTVTQRGHRTHKLGATFGPIPGKHC